MAKHTITVNKHSVRYFLDGWPTEDILTFLENVVSALTNLVERAYKTFPSHFDFHIATGPVHAEK
ncbi:MAG TPA: hypothetical protein VHM88_25820 [Candidatus Acidoferrales bacterium]|nr:hypothetical protein [Candidatus Acidoferrales bacterium]